jgi:signal transduction histidine kinase
MPRNPWLAVDVKTSPTAAARALRRFWDAFVEDGRIDAVRLPIAASWQRSRAAGVDPFHSRAPTTLGDRAEVAAHWETHPLEAAAPLIRAWLGAVADESENLIVVSDAKGQLLWVEGDAKVRSAAADAMNFVEGALWSEAGAGTNAIGTALAADHPVQVHAAEHFNEVVHAWTCSAAPIHDPDTGELLGIVDLTGRMKTAHPHSLGLALMTARAIESDLRSHMEERDAALRDRYLAGIGSSREHVALASRSGRVIADHPGGLVRSERLEIPHGGGELLLPSGMHGFAETIGHDEGFIIRPLAEAHGAVGSLERAHPIGSQTRSAAAHWRRAQVALTRLAEEHAALRRVATLVASQAEADQIFAAVAEEVARLLHADRGTVCRYESDESMTVVAYWSQEGTDIPIGVRVALDGDSVAATLRQTAGTARFDSYDGLAGSVIDMTRSLGSLPRSTVGATIIVDNRVWGTILASTTRAEPLSDDAESRIMDFAELVGTAISNAVGRAELAASRARIVATADETRRRIERNLHDGLQQRLVTLTLELQGFRAASPTPEALLAGLSHAETEIGSALDELRETARGIHPAILAEGGLEPALRTLAGRSAVPVEIEMSNVARLPEPVEVAAYYVVSEALANMAKHAHASTGRVAVTQEDGTLSLSVSDDGFGGADPARGSGLTGLRDRVEATGGTIVVESPPGAGTSLLATFPTNKT